MRTKKEKKPEHKNKDTEKQGVLSSIKNFFKKIGSASKAVISGVVSATKNWAVHLIVNLLLQLKIVWDRAGLINRTGKIFNFARFFYSIQGYYLNPIEEERELGEYEKEVNKIFGPMKAIPMDVKEQDVAVCDAGILKNVCVESVMRPQRTPDLVLVMDFNAYDSDDYFNYQPLFEAAAQAWRQGIRFPSVNFKDVANRPPEELLVFESDDDDQCPTVLWFTLCNRKFRNLKNYKPRSGGVSSPKKPFNNFPVYGPGSKYATQNFKYSKEDFNKLHELMYFNLTSNIQIIKQEILKAVARKQRKIGMKSRRQIQPFSLPSLRKRDMIFF